LSRKPPTPQYLMVISSQKHDDTEPLRAGECVERKSA
jgi:hypothetical protein